LTGPFAVDTIAPTDGWQDSWLEKESERRAASPWAGRAASEATVDA
jgi:hypothetical protein